MDSLSNPHFETETDKEDSTEGDRPKNINLVLPVGIIAFILVTAILLVTQGHPDNSQAGTTASTQDDSFSFLGTKNNSQQNIKGEKTGPALGPTLTNSSPIPSHPSSTPKSTPTPNPTPTPTPSPSPDETPTPTPSPSQTPDPSPTPTDEPAPSSSP